MRCWLSFVLSVCTASFALRAQTEAAPVRPDEPKVSSRIDAMVAQLGLPGAALVIGVGDRVLHTSEHGAVAATTVLPIASASKWLAVATVLTLVDAGQLDLDAPVCRYLPEFDTPEKRLISLRRCLSCTAGIPPLPTGVRELPAEFDAVTKAIAATPLRGQPGLQWEYGGASFQVAAAAAVRVAGCDWHTLFRRQLGAPLDLHDTAFGRLTPPGDGAGTTAVPWVAGGAVSTLRDYARFVQMLAQDGAWQGKRVLQAPTVARMFASMTDGMPVHQAAFGDEALAYGLGTWLQALPGGAVRGSDAGAFGFTPWIDRDLGVWGVFAVQDRVGRVLPRVQPIQTLARDLVHGPEVAGRDEVVTLAHGGRDRRYLLHVPPKAERALALPLLVVLHGGGGHGAQVAATTGFSALADRESFAVVYPDGTGPLRGQLLTWNSGGIPVYARDEKVDDVGFLRAVVESVKTKVAIDPRRVHATGISNGAMMCHRLAREAADVFAGIAPVSGSMDFTAVDSTVPIAVMIVHGTADEHVRYDGGRPAPGLGRAALRRDASVADAIAYYRTRNGLDPEPSLEVDGKVRVQTWQRQALDAAGGAAKDAPPPVRVVTLEGGRHAWPGGRRGDYPGADAPFDWPASERIWQFLRDQTLRAK